MRGGTVTGVETCALPVSRWLHAGESPSLGKALIVLLTSMLACALIGMVIERLAYKPVRKIGRASCRERVWISVVEVARDNKQCGDEHARGRQPRLPGLPA